VERIQAYHMQETIYRKALFDPDKLKERAMKLEKKANRLSMAIEKQNHLKGAEVENECTQTC